RPEHRERALLIARNRIAQGPLVDALECAPLLGDGEALRSPESFEAMARMEVLVWEAGACALQLPTLGKWIWSSLETFETLVENAYSVNSPNETKILFQEDGAALCFLRREEGAKTAQLG
ncbi:MAG: hypothetical protein CFK52_14985, partial [Chloracidobacterium sp. CP2_5A]